MAPEKGPDVMSSMGFSYGVSHLSYTGEGSQYCPPNFLMLEGLGIVLWGPLAARDPYHLRGISPLDGF